MQEGSVNKSAVESQINGAAIMGLGLTLSEEMNFENGKLLNSGFLDYRLLTTLDAPEFEAIIVESNQRDGPFGAKGTGEIGIVAIGVRDSQCSPQCHWNTNMEVAHYFKGDS